MRAAPLVLLLACAHRMEPPGPPAVAQEEMVFRDSTPLSRNEEIARRTLTPLTLLHGQRALAARHEAFREQPIDVAREKFAVYVPPGAPPDGGWGLLVWIAPWDQATLPQLWRPALDRHQLIFVSAANSGNDAKVLDRRVPLALLAWHNVRARYPLDGRRVYVGGLSGGSRAAEITALAYPDVFRGALLNAGSDPIGGEAGIYLPMASLFHQFQRTRLVYVTGDEDDLNQHDDLVSRASMREWCVFDVDVKVAHRTGHQSLDPATMERALDSLDQGTPADEAALARCNARIEQEMTDRLAEAEAAVAAGDAGRARALLLAIDRRYAGLAAARLEALDQQLGRY
jgi:hypothetical protein